MRSDEPELLASLLRDASHHVEEAFRQVASAANLLSITDPDHARLALVREQLRREMNDLGVFSRAADREVP